MITGLYAGIFAIVQVAMVFWIAKSRWDEKVVLGTGESGVLLRKTRVYGNFVEIVPIALILMGIAELNGSSALVLHAMGGILILSRIAHARGLLVKPSFGIWRLIGVLFAAVAIMTGAGLCIVQAIF